VISLPVDLERGPGYTIRVSSLTDSTLDRRQRRVHGGSATVPSDCRARIWFDADDITHNYCLFTTYRKETGAFDK